MKDEHRCGAKSKTTMETTVHLERKLEEDDEGGSVELQTKIVRHFSIEISLATIRRFIWETLIWTVVQTRFGPMANGVLLMYYYVL